MNTFCVVWFWFVPLFILICMSHVYVLVSNFNHERLSERMPTHSINMSRKLHTFSTSFDFLLSLVYNIVLVSWSIPTMFPSRGSFVVHVICASVCPKCQTRCGFLTIIRWSLFGIFECWYQIITYNMNVPATKLLINKTI